MSSAKKTGFDGRLSAALQMSVVNDEGFSAVLELIAERFGCLSAALVYVDAGQPGSTIEIGHGVLDEVARRRYRDSYSKDDPAPAAMARLSVGQVVTTDRLFDIEDQKFSRFRQDFYYPLGLREAMGGPVIKADGQFGVLAVQRGADRVSFNDDEIAEFSRIVPLVASALALRRRFFALEEAVSELKEAVEDTSVATMIFTGSGRLKQANRLARQILERQDGILLTPSGQLRLAEPALDTRLRSLFRSGQPEAPTLIRVPRASPQGPTSCS